MKCSQMPLRTRSNVQFLIKMDKILHLYSSKLLQLDILLQHKRRFETMFMRIFKRLSVERLPRKRMYYVRA